MAIENITADVVSKAASTLLYTGALAVSAVVVKWTLQPLWQRTVKRRRLLTEAQALRSGILNNADQSPTPKLPPFGHSKPFLSEIIIFFAKLVAGLFKFIGGLVVLSICMAFYVQGPWYLRPVGAALLMMLSLLWAAYSQMFPNCSEPQWQSERERLGAFWVAATFALFFVLVTPLLISHFQPIDLSGEP